MKEIYRLPFEEAVAHAEIESLKKQRDELQARIDEVLAIPPRPIPEGFYGAGRSYRRGFNQFRSLAQKILTRPAKKEEDHG